MKFLTSATIICITLSVTACNFQSKEGEVTENSNKQNIQFTDNDLQLPNISEMQLHSKNLIDGLRNTGMNCDNVKFPAITGELIYSESLENAAKRKLTQFQKISDFNQNLITEDTIETFANIPELSGNFQVSKYAELLDVSFAPDELAARTALVNGYGIRVDPEVCKAIMNPEYTHIAWYREDGTIETSFTSAGVKSMGVMYLTNFKWSGE